MSKRQETNGVVKDREYFKRIGGYQGPVKLTSKQVPCAVCKAEPGEPCLNRKSPHPCRIAYAAELTERANSDLPIARWYRSEFRAGRIPKPPEPCGSIAAYQRHKRNIKKGIETGPIDAACEKAAREYWSENKRTNKLKQSA